MPAASLAAVEIPYLSRKIHKCVTSVRTLKQTIGGRDVAHFLSRKHCGNEKTDCSQQGAKIY